jgi:hypothetical protein
MREPKVWARFSPSQEAQLTKGSREQGNSEAAVHEARNHELQCNIGTAKPDCEGSEFQGSRESKTGAWRAYWGNRCSLPPQ